jgi:NADPH:quinone reductase-like Zn-dependent oxidoreductase
MFMTRAGGTLGGLLDFFGGGYVAMAVEHLKLSPDKVDTIADFEAVKRFGVQSKGGADAATAAVLAELAGLITRGELEVPIAGVFALDDVRDAFRQLELRHTLGQVGAATVKRTRHRLSLGFGCGSNVKEEIHE